MKPYKVVEGVVYMEILEKYWTKEASIGKRIKVFLQEEYRRTR